MKQLLFAILVATSTCVVAQTGWLRVASTDDGSLILDAREGSYVLIKNGAGEPIALVTGKATYSKTNQINLQKWYVRVKDCSAREGKVVTLSMEGEFLFDNDFIDGTGNMATAKAEFVCNVHEYLQDQKKKKSL